MSLEDHYEAIARYNSWMNRRLYAQCADELSDEQRKRDLGAFFHSIHGTFNHILLADRAWLRRLTGDRDRFTSRNSTGEPIAITGLDQELYADFGELRRQREQTDRDIEQWVSGLDATSLDRMLTYKTSKGIEFSHPLWQAVSHMFNHQTHHRGQVTTLMMQLGVDPGVTDLAVFLRDPEAG